MRAAYQLFVSFLGLILVKAEDVEELALADQLKTRETPIRLTDVVSHAFCESRLQAEDNMAKNSLKEVHTYAELKHDPRASLPDRFTICSTIMIPNCLSRAWPTFFAVLSNNRTQILSPIGSPASIVTHLKILYLQGASEQANGKIPPIFPNKWTRSCMAINTKSGLIHWVVEGTLIMATISEEVKNSKNRPKDLSRKIVLGGRSYKGGWVATSNKVTNLNIFSSALSIEKMKRMTEGESCLEEGDYLAWGDMEWILHGQARIETVGMEEPCKGDPLVNLYYTKFPDIYSCIHHCENLGTRVPSVTNSQDWTTLRHFLKTNLFDKKLNTLFLWLPVNDRMKEGEWRDFYTDKVIQNYTEADGGTVQNCAKIFDGDTWVAVICDSPHYACMCTHKPSKYLEFKGLCQGSSIDVYYKPISDLTDSRKLNFQGLSGTSITYDNEQRMWILSVTHSNVTGISKATHASFLLGKHNWTIKGDKGCNEGESYVELKMSGCQKGKFTCNDGQCVGMDQRCNQLSDCRDESDERNCKILVLKDGYNMEVPPIVSGGPVDVSVSIDLLKIVDIDEEDYSIEIQFEITLKWKENRATYNNLKKRDSLNALKQRDFGRLWLPEVIYENTDQKKTTRLGSNWEWKTRVIVKREGNYSLSGLDSLDETEIFLGHENSLEMSQTYTHTFQCAYRLSAYPFDTQVN